MFDLRNATDDAALSLDDDAPDQLFDVTEPQTTRERLRLLVHFLTREDRQTFSQLIGQLVTERTPIISYPIANRLPSDFFQAVEQAPDDASSLFDVEENWQETWRGMPAYVHQDLQPLQTVSVCFEDQTSRQAFARLLNQTVTDETKYLWFPKANVDKVVNLRWRSTHPQNPKYPVYVPTKGRWDSAFTIKCLERLRVPYYAVVQPQERAHYEGVVKTGVMLVLPESLDGLVPTRNWILDHSIRAGDERHWQLDDNIKSFFRFHENRQIHVDDGTCLRIAEDFADRYENIAIAGFQYFMFVKRKFLVPPYLFNTRVYSNSLINNHMPFRYRDVYNDDTDICLRALKAGWCTVQYHAFLAWKQPTMIVKGGNTPIYLGAEAVAAAWEAHVRSCKQCTIDESPTCATGREILSKDGRWRMAESLQRQHPDVTTIGRRFRRWQHFVDYRRFKKNVPVLRSDVIIPEGQDEYGLELVEVPSERPPALKVVAAATPAALRPSVFDFLDSQPVEARQPVAVSQPLAAGPSAPKQGPANTLAQPGSLPISSLGQPGRLLDSLLNLSSQSAEEFLSSLKSRGHDVLTKDGRLFTTNASKLTDDDRLELKRLKAELIALIEQPVIEQPTETLFNEPKRTMIQFLGQTSERSDPDWRPDEPPSLSGIDEIILNFATTGFDWHKDDRPVGVTVSTLDGRLARFLPFAFRGGNLDEATVKRWAQTELKNKKIYNSKTKFDVHHSRVWGVDLEAQGCTFSDVQHTAALLDDHRKRFGIDVLAADYLPDLQTVPRLDESRHNDYEASEVADRERYTARLVGKLKDVLYPQIDAQELRVVHDLEDAVIPAVVEMEKNGAPIDLELLDQYHRESHKIYDALMWEIAREAGFAFEHKDSGWTRLIEKLGLPVPDSFSESVLNELDHPTIRKAQRASQYASLNSKIFDAYKKVVDADGLLRFEINQLRGEKEEDSGAMGTVSGRFSIGIVQQVPNFDNHSAVFGDDLFPRRLFLPGSGEYLEADAKQIEYRLFAHYANNQKVLAAYRDDPLLSFHEMTWGMMKAYKPDMVYSHQKRFNFAKQYGARSIKLAVMMNFIKEAEGNEIRRAKRWDDPRLDLIHEIEKAYRQMMPEGDLLLDYASHLAKSTCDEYCKPNDKMHRQYQHRGFVKTLLGRRSRFPNNYKTYIGLNRVLQGTGADIMKQKLVELHRERKKTGFVMRLTIHDAVGGDAPTPETAELVTTILNRQSFPQLKVPILWSVKAGPNWAEAK